MSGHIRMPAQHARVRGGAGWARRTWLAAASGLVVLGLAGCGPKPDSGPTAAPFFEQTLADLAGTPTPMEKYRGRPVLVNFWATWCAPCVKEMPDLDALHTEFPQVAFVGIGIDSAANLAQFVQKIPVRYDLFEAQASGLGLSRELGSTTGGLPYTVLIGADGRILQTFMGQISKDTLRPQLQRLAGPA